MNEILSLLASTIQLYSEFGHKSFTTREYLAYSDLRIKAEIYRGQLLIRWQESGKPTPQEVDAIIAEIKYDFIRSFYDSHDISKIVEDYAESELLSIEASLS